MRCVTKLLNGNLLLLFHFKHTNNNVTVCDRNVIVEIHIIHIMIVNNDLTNNVSRGINTYMEYV